MGCGALAMRSTVPMPSSKMSSIRLETSIPTQRRGKIMGPVPVMRGLFAQPRATVQVDGRNGRETEPAYGVKRQGPNGFPPTFHHDRLVRHRDPYAAADVVRADWSTASLQTIAACGYGSLLSKGRRGEGVDTPFLVGEKAPVTIAPPDQISAKPDYSARRQWLAVIALIAAMTAMRLVYAGVLELRTDEAYYWTWSKEGALSFLDHPPMIAWFIRFGTALFGDTNLGVRFAGILAMLVTQLLLADIVRRVTHNFRAVVLAVLLPEAALYYGLLMAKVSPDTALIPFAVAMLWALVRLTESGDARWWLAAGLFAGLALLSKFTAIMLLPAVAAFMLVPDWRRRWLFSPYPWLAALIAALLFSPVVIWNAQHDWASFKFQLVRAAAVHEFSWSRIGEFLGLQLGQVGPVLLPVVLSGVVLTAWRGYRKGNAVAILLSTCVLVPFGYFVWKSMTLRIGDTWPMFLWPAGFAAAAINIALLPRENWPAWMIQSTMFWARTAIASGLV